jgi:hypothetical protein
MAFKDWSQTAANNATADATISWSEGQAPSTVNDSGRAMMSALAVWRDLIDYGTVSGGTVGGSGNAITLVCSPTVTAREAGRRYLFKAGAANTSTVTLTVDSTAAGAIQYLNTALVSGDIATNDVLLVEDDGTNFQLLTPPRISTFGLVNGLTADGTGATGDFLLSYDISTSLPKKVLFSTFQTLFAASQANMEAASSNAVYVTPGRTQNHPGVCKAWANFTCRGTDGTCTLNASHNITSVTRNGAGTYDVVIGTDMSSANYSVLATVQDSSPVNAMVVLSAAAAGTCTLSQISASAGTAYDGTGKIHFAMFGDQ